MFIKLKGRNAWSSVRKCIHIIHIYSIPCQKVKKLLGNSVIPPKSPPKSSDQHLWFDTNKNSMDSAGICLLAESSLGAAAPAHPGQAQLILLRLCLIFLICEFRALFALPLVRPVINGQFPLILSSSH